MRPEHHHLAEVKPFIPNRSAVAKPEMSAVVQPKMKKKDFLSVEPDDLNDFREGKR